MLPRRASSSRLLVPLVALLAGGCGYTLSSVLPPHIKTLAVPVFANSTVEFGIADDVTRALQDAFLADRRLKIVGERQADSVLRGTVLAYKNQPFSYTREEKPTQYEIILTVRLLFRDLVKARDVWKEDAFTVRSTYNVVPVGSAPAKTEAEARADLVKSLADQIVSRTVQGW
ncbi:MAG TPA: LptE family protein [Candidatus Limnocylindrales bacterium]|nr:LptE family protein [Candidatus Limnocylindrales bacterium]